MKKIFEVHLTGSPKLAGCPAPAPKYIEAHLIESPKVASFPRQR